MKPRISSRTIAYGLFVTTLLACGGSATVSGLTDPATNFLLGQQSLDTALQTAGSGGNPTTQIQEAYYRFDTAYRQEPTPVRAIMLALVTQLKAEDQLTRLFGTSTSRSTDKTKNLVASLAKSLAPWKGRQIGIGSIHNPLAYLASLVGTYETSRAYPNDPTPTAVRNAFLSLEADLRRAIESLSDANIAGLEAAPLTIDDPNSTDPAKRVRFGKAEALTLRANCQGFLGVLDLVLAYDFGWLGEFNFNQALNSAYSGNVAAGTTIDRSTLVPPAPFGSLFTGSSDRLSRFQQDWGKSATDVTAAVNTFKGRTASAAGEVKWLGESINFTTSELNGFGSDAIGLASAVSSQVNVTVNGVAKVMDIPAFVANAPSLGSLLPNLTAATEGANYRFSPIAGTNNGAAGGLYTSNISFNPVVLAPNNSKGALTNKLFEQVW